MSTHAKTTVYSEQTLPILSFYRQMDGYFDGHGKELQEFLKEMVVVNGYGSDCVTKTANGMSCLAAQLVAHFKKGIGNIYICEHNDSQEYNYAVKYVPQGDGAGYTAGCVSLTGTSKWEKPPIKEFPLYSDDILPPKILKTVTFVYVKPGEAPKWRVVQVTEENETHLKGFDVEDDYIFKHFLKSKILGGRLLPV